MSDIQQLVKKNTLGETYNNIFPKTFFDAITDKETGTSLKERLAMFNMLFLSYVGSKSLTRAQVPLSFRREGLWVTYVMYDKTVVTEWYAGEAIDDDSWGNGSNWRNGSNALVGDITISSTGYWVINGEVTTIEAQGEAGITPMIRINDNKMQVSYTNGSSWNIISDYIAAWFKFTGTTGSSQADNVGKIQISRDNGATWSDLSEEFTNSLHIKGYVATVGALPSSAVQGDIYGVGPTYDSSDTEQTNPIYQLYVKDSTGWVNNGRFTSIAAGIVQELGDSETAVMSQKAVTENLERAEADIRADFARADRAESAARLLEDISLGQRIDVVEQNVSIGNAYINSRINNLSESLDLKFDKTSVVYLNENEYQVLIDNDLVLPGVQYNIYEE